MDKDSGRAYNKNVKELRDRLKRLSMNAEQLTSYVDLRRKRMSEPIESSFTVQLDPGDSLDDKFMSGLDRSKIRRGKRKSSSNI